MNAPQAGTQPAAAPATGAAGETAAAAEARKRAAASNFLPIVRGRLPMLFVHAVRYDATLKEMANKDLAAKFGTSVGKIFDIKKGRNFAYVTEKYKPTAEDVAAAKDWIKQVGTPNSKGQTAQGDATVMGKVVADYEKRGLATADDTKALTDARGAARVAAKTAAPAAGSTTPATGTAGKEKASLLK